MSLESVNLLGAVVGAGRGWQLMAIYVGYMLVATLVIGAIVSFLGG
jgi:hypothetical protein